MLLGLVRSDKLIPWTSDNDYIASKQTIAYLLQINDEENAVFEEHGLSFFFDMWYHRVCIMPNFMGGDLALHWTDTDKTSASLLYPLVYIYADVFIGTEVEYKKEDGGNTGDNKDNNSNSTKGQQQQKQSRTLIVDQLSCDHPVDYYRPAKRIGVYNNSFTVSVPQNAKGWLERVYGQNWKVPDASKNPHGNTNCHND
mmetsp:Transcript_19392/g.33279  ORF Transcript_19392/g.33279 Transcript_19392/m.33279 type:complete len:198 (-) Transcript_19392:63-656(-)